MRRIGSALWSTATTAASNGSVNSMHGSYSLAKKLVPAGQGEASPSFIFAIAVRLWFTVLFAKFAEAMAEGRGKAQADTL